MIVRSGISRAVSVGVTGMVHRPGASPLAGSFAHGNSVTLTGSGFGTKATAAPVKYDDFQSVTTNSAITTSAASGPTWVSGGGSIDPVASTAKLRSGTPFTKNMRCRWTPIGGSDASGSNVYFFHDFTKLYLDAWFYHDTTGNLTSVQNVKPWRIHTNGAGDPNTSGCVLVSGPGGGVVNNASDGDVPDDGQSDFFPGLDGTELVNGWVHLQQLLHYGSGNGTIDGTGITLLTGNVTASHSLIGNMNPGRSGFTHWTDLWIGNYIRSEDWTGAANFYWESVYIDDTWARVEIGDNATYSACTHREVQRPSAWSGTSVTFTVNRGAFATNAAVTIFVVNSSNTVVATQAATLGTSY